ncbi:SusC/RagA family TonB-linked outer membrane protein [Ohtaekwangia sp.]|uniref:SusC/RagA family TonB-linked outer membrane protein n=1 Tax=Ohtaekwangia sp. TaxID=2066019 RepID=UPI002FDD5C1C
MRKILLFALLCLLSFQLVAQERTVTGKVTSAEDGTSLPGVNVILKGTTTGVVTDVDGRYSIQIPASGGTLVFTFIGIETKEIEIGDKSVINVPLAPDITQLSEVVVVGYGTQSKRDISGSIASVKGSDIALAPVQSFEQALGGRAAGVSITVPNGVLNNPPVIRIRGVNSINLSSYPLIVIDGIPTYSGDNSTNSAPNNPLSNLNTSDIESIEVLKDASASAIYGSRAAAGVILITTKRGAKGKSKFTYDAWVGWTKPVRLFDMLNADDYMMIKNEAIANLNENTRRKTGTYGTAIEGSFRYPKDANGNDIPTNTRWYDYVYRTGFSHSNSLSFSGASDNTSYYMSVGHTKQEGMLKRNEFERTSLRLNLDHKVFDRFTIGTSFSFANITNSAPNSGSLSGQAYGTAGLGRLPLVLPPNVAAYNADGTYNLNGAGLGAGGNLNPTSNPSSPGALVTGYYNPALILDKNTFTSESNQVQGNIYAAWEVVKGLTLKTTYGIDRISFEDISFQTSLGGDGYNLGGSATNNYRTNKRWNWQNTIQYDLEVGKHFVSILAGGEQQYTKVDRWGAQRTSIADVYFTTFEGNYTNIAVANNLQGENYLVSYFSRINYDFGKKYFVSLNVRRDGYSAWADKYGNFYGASVGYTISEEDFWKNNPILGSINFFKLKGSYGEVGNSQGVNDFASLNTYSSGLYGSAATLGYNQAGNSLLTWETSKKTDVGFTYGILHDRIQGEFSWYRNLVDGLILDVAQAPSKGIPNPTTANTIPANIGSLENKGIEFSIKFNAISNADFSWIIGGNVTTLKNKVLALTSDADRIGTATSSLETSNYTTVGRSLGSILAVPTIGVNPDNGRRLFVKADGTIVQYDHGGAGTGWSTLEGNAISAPTQLQDGVYYNAIPKWYGGLDNTFKYKNFDLGIFFQFSGGNYIYNGTKSGLRDQRFWNNHTDVLDRWTPEHTNGSIPRVVYGDNISNGTALVISENVEKGDFIRLKNVSLGYSVPKSILEKIKIANARIYGQVQNAFLITGYKGIDPEISSNGNSTTGGSVDRNSVGQARTFTVGVNVGF